MAQEEGAQEKTLEPSERKLQKAREEGRFAQSRDLTFALTLVLMASLVAIAGSQVWAALVQVMAQALHFGTSDPLDKVSEWASGPLFNLALWLLGLLLAGAGAGLVGALLLNSGRPVFRWRFDLSRLDPIAGFGRMFSVRNLFALAKGVLVSLLLAGVTALYFHAGVDGLMVSPSAALTATMMRLGRIVAEASLWILLAVGCIALIDAAFQYSTFRREMRMSYQELKDELKETEGSPEVRQRIRSLQRAAARQRMVAAVEKADVLVVNPTHVAVALRYESQTMVAPIVVAKGQDEVAFRMKQVASSCAVPVAQYPPLARWLAANVDVGHPVPPMAYTVVAKVLAWALERPDDPPPAIELDAVAMGDTQASSS